LSEKGQIIFEYISANPGKKSAEIAGAVGSEKRIVNGILHGELKGKAKPTGDYRWVSVEPGNPPDTQTSIPSPSSNSLISRLCRYYLECLSQEDLGKTGKGARTSFWRRSIRARPTGRASRGLDSGSPSSILLCIRPDIKDALKAAVEKETRSSSSMIEVMIQKYGGRTNRHPSWVGKPDKGA
jgi:hypothetical protein